MNQLIAGSIYDLIPPDDEETNFLESLKEKDYSEYEESEEEHYLEFLSSVNSRDVLHLHYIEEQTPYMIANILNVPTRFIEKLINEDRRKNQAILRNVSKKIDPKQRDSVKVSD